MITQYSPKYLLRSENIALLRKGQKHEQEDDQKENKRQEKPKDRKCKKYYRHSVANIHTTSHTVFSNVAMFPDRSSYFGELSAQPVLDFSALHTKLDILQWNNQLVSAFWGTKYVMETPVLSHFKLSLAFLPTPITLILIYLHWSNISQCIILTSLSVKQ